MIPRAARVLAPYLTLFMFYTLVVIVFGAFVRATGSGAGCGAHWPLCNGELIPASTEGKTWVEYTHRVTSGLCWFLAAGLVLLARSATARGHAIRFWSVLVLVLMTTEALIGAGLVVFEKVADDASVGRAFWMGAHLINTFFLLASMMFAWCHRHGPRDSGFLSFRRQRPGIVVSWVLAVLALGLVGISGAIAALGDTLFPVATLSEGLAADLSPTGHVFVRLRVFHPVLAIAAVALSCGLGGTVLATGESAIGRRFAGSMLVLGAIQLGVGALNVYLLAPVWLQLVHLALADALWLCLVGMGFHLFWTRRLEKDPLRGKPRADRQLLPG